MAISAGEAQVNTGPDYSRSVVASQIPVGVSTYLGVGLTIIAALGALVAGVKSNDTATIAAAATSLLAAISTIGSRGAQSVAAIKSAAVLAAPTVNAIAEFEDHEVDEINHDNLPTDAVEFDSTPWKDVEREGGAV